MRKFILINSRLERAHSSQCSAVQCSTIKNYKYVNQQMIPFPRARNSSRAKQPLWVSRENVTELLHWLQDLFQIKIENICVFKLIKKKHGNVFKKWLCPNFLLLPKKSELPKIWGGCSPPRPPGPYAYDRQYKPEADSAVHLVSVVLHPSFLHWSVFIYSKKLLKVSRN